MRTVGLYLHVIFFVSNWSQNVQITVKTKCQLSVMRSSLKYQHPHVRTAGLRRMRFKETVHFATFSVLSES